MSKIKFELEFPIHASPTMLYQYFSITFWLGEWFADNVNSRGANVYLHLGRSRRGSEAWCQKQMNEHGLNGWKMRVRKRILSLKFKLMRLPKMCL